MQEAGVFESVQQCTEAGFDTATCETSYAEAQAQDAQVAPKYESKADCEEDFGPGKCDETKLTEENANRVPQQQTSNGGGNAFLWYYLWFRPHMAGYTAGPGVASQPLYRNWDSGTHSPGAFRNAEASTVSTRTGRVTVPSRTVASKPSMTRTTTVTRGVFGGRGGGFGGHGGS